MPIELKMPALSPTMEKGNLAKWLVAEGDMVKAGDLLAEIETDKATMEFEAVDDGRIAKLLVAEGTDDVTVGSVIALLAEDGDAAEATPADPVAADPAPAAASGVETPARAAAAAAPTPAAPVAADRFSAPRPSVMGGYTMGPRGPWEEARAGSTDNRPKKGPGQHVSVASPESAASRGGLRRARTSQSSSHRRETAQTGARPIEFPGCYIAPRDIGRDSGAEQPQIPVVQQAMMLVDEAPTDQLD